MHPACTLYVQTERDLVPPAAFKRRSLAGKGPEASEAGLSSSLKSRVTTEEIGPGSSDTLGRGAVSDTTEKVPGGRLHASTDSSNLKEERAATAWNHWHRKQQHIQGYFEHKEANFSSLEVACV